MISKYFGYIRVSTVEQHTERQREELKKWGIKEENIFTDKVSGKNFNRPSYLKLKSKLHEGDVLVVKSIDRLGRNYEEIQAEWRTIIKEIKADIVIIDMPILDTRINKDLIGTLISDIVLQILSYVAQAEREYIRQRQAEGIAIAKAQGKHLGRVRKDYPQNFKYYFKKWEEQVFTIIEISEFLNISERSCRYLFKRYKQEIIEMKLNQDV